MPTRVGDIVEIKEKDRIVAGVALAAAEKYFQILTADSRTLKVPAEKILFNNSGLDTAKGKDFLLSSLREIQKKREDLKEGIQLKLLWEIVGESQEVRTPQQLAQIYFGDDFTPDHTAALIRSLQKDWGYFRPRGDGYFTVDSKTVKVMEEGRMQQEAHKKKEESFVLWLSRGGREPLPESASGFLSILKDFFIFAEQSEKSRQAQELLKKARLADHDQIFEILVRNGVFEENENLLLKKFHVPGPFSHSLEKEAENILQNFSRTSLSSRSDMTSIQTFTIDEETTTDIDDALSLEVLPDSWRIGVHIADGAEFVLKDSPLDKEAHARSTSIYLPDQKITMLPHSITEAASLKKGEPRPALSVLARFHRNGQLISWEMKETLVCVRERFTYEEADERLEGDPVLSKLHELALHFQEERIKAGGLVIHFPRVEVYYDARENHAGEGVDERAREYSPEDCFPVPKALYRDKESGEIRIKRLDCRSRSQVLVSEWMILANRLVANFCLQNRIPVLYRAQEPPGKIFSIQEGDIVTLFKQRRYLRKGEASVAPSPHHGLGLPVYLQMTSPIRRYSDLVIHRQLKAHLRKETLPYREEDLEAVRAYSERWVEIAELVERETRKYWLYKVLEKKIGEKFDAIVLEANLNDYQLFLPDFALEVTCTRGIKNFSEGDRLSVRLELVKPRQGLLKVIAE